MDTQQQIDAIQRAIFARRTVEAADRRQHTIGSFIAELKTLPQDATVCYEWFGGVIGANQVASYRGYYEDLSLVPSGAMAMSVKATIAMLKKAIGREYTGYKGGRYRMHEHTLLWIDTYGEALGIGVFDAVQQPDGSILVTTRKVDP